MGQIPSPDDRPDPNERSTAVRARVPEHVATGNVSTGVIVVTGRPNLFSILYAICLDKSGVARIVMPHAVMPQFVDALNNNMQIYRQRFGDVGLGGPPVKAPSDRRNEPKHRFSEFSIVDEPARRPLVSRANRLLRAAKEQVVAVAVEVAVAGRSSYRIRIESSLFIIGPQNPSSSGPRQQSPQEVYDELKLRMNCEWSICQCSDDRSWTP